MTTSIKAKLSKSDDERTNIEYRRIKYSAYFISQNQKCWENLSKNILKFSMHNLDLLKVKNWITRNVASFSIYDYYLRGPLITT